MEVPQELFGIDTSDNGCNCLVFTFAILTGKELTDDDAKIVRDQVAACTRIVRCA